MLAANQAFPQKYPMEQRMMKSFWKIPISVLIFLTATGTCFSSEKNIAPTIPADCRFPDRAMIEPTPEADAIYKRALLYDSDVDNEMYPPKADWSGKNDDAKAIELYAQAARMGHAKAMRRLGDALYRGGTAADLAVRFYVKALEAGNLDAYSSLASVYLYGDNGIEKDTEKGMACLYRGAEAGDAHTQLVLGAILLRDLDHLLQMPTPKDAPFDPIKAEQWLIKAGESGKLQAYELLARYYYNKPDLTRSEEYARAGAAKGDKQSLIFLANAYRSEGKFGHNPLLAFCFQKLADAAQKGVSIDLDAACPRPAPSKE